MALDELVHFFLAELEGDDDELVWDGAVDLSAWFDEDAPFWPNQYIDGLLEWAG